MKSKAVACFELLLESNNIGGFALHTAAIVSMEILKPAPVVQIRSILRHNAYMTGAPSLPVPFDQLREICQRYQIRELGLFGSAARGEMRAESDVDILVEFAPEARIGLEFFDLERELSLLFGRKVDLGTKVSLKPWVRPNVLRDLQILYAS